MTTDTPRGWSKDPLRHLTRDELCRLYHTELLSQGQIAGRFGVTQGAILYWFKKWQIAARGHDDSLILLGKSGRFSGPKNPRWNGGRHVQAGYVMIRRPDHPKAGARGYVREHILVWEESNGVSLPKGWHVHHKNGNKADNRPENLEAMSHRKHRDVLPELLRRIAALESQVKELSDAVATCCCGQARRSA